MYLVSSSYRSKSTGIIRKTEILINRNAGNPTDTHTEINNNFRCLFWYGKRPNLLHVSTWKIHRVYPVFRVRRPDTLNRLGTNGAPVYVSAWSKFLWQHNANPDVGSVLPEGILVPDNEGFTRLQETGLAQMSQASGQIGSGGHLGRFVVHWSI
jgi:hypothetical protein